jgi:hypothetical protein
MWAELVVNCDHFWLMDLKRLHHCDKLTIGGHQFLARRHSALGKRQINRVVYRFGIFGRYSVGISRYLPYRYRRKTRSVHFGIKKGAVPPFFLKRGAMAPFLRSSPPFGKKGGGKGGIDTDRNTENPTNLIPAKYRYRKNCRYHRGIQLYKLRSLSFSGGLGRASPTRNNHRIITEESVNIDTPRA